MNRFTGRMDGDDLRCGALGERVGGDRVERARISCRSRQPRDCWRGFAPAMEKLSYTPHAGARSLRKRSSGLLGLVVGDITNPFFSDLFEAVEDAAAAARGYLVLLCNSNERTEREEAHLKHAAHAAHRRADSRADRRRFDEPGRRCSPSSKCRSSLVDRAMEGLRLRRPWCSTTARPASRRRTIRSACGHHTHRPRSTAPRSSAPPQTACSGYREALLAAGLLFDPGTGPRRPLSASSPA